jgi:hypothetical protein
VQPRKIPLNLDSELAGAAPLPATRPETSGEVRAMEQPPRATVGPQASETAPMPPHVTHALTCGCGVCRPK